MSLSIVYARALVGVEAPSVRVETHLSNGLPAFTIVGLPEAAVKESRERVRSAILNSGLEFPMRRVTVNLAPADLPKEGGRFDLAIAIGILVASGQLDNKAVELSEFVSELSLGGQCIGVRGILTALLALPEAKKVFVSAENTDEVALAACERVYSCNTLAGLVAHLRDPETSAWQQVAAAQNMSPLNYSQESDMSHVQGQFGAKHALKVAACGGHNLLFYGPPGTGKSMLASRMPSIMPGLSREQAIEVASIYALGSHERGVHDWFLRPFRSPHHSSSAAALVGGGSKPKPGEVSLAHHGVLFLDELPEFSRHVLEVLREPIEAKKVAISRAQVQATFPASFQLIAAMNPCPCGYAGHPKVACTDTPQKINQYLAKLSGPLLDRFDMHVEVPFQSASITLSNKRSEESSAQIRDQVLAAHALQIARQGSLNNDLNGDALVEVCNLSEKQARWLSDVIDRLAMSGRAAHRIMRVARTLADIDGERTIGDTHLSQAVQYRGLTRQ
jgi:magnesium chelatase family protein